jgi:hypothetical protein
LINKTLFSVAISNSQVNSNNAVALKAAAFLFAVART